MRARDLGLDLAGTPGPLNGITDVPGLTVGTVTRIEDTDDAAVAARTGVTAILPLGRDGVGSSVPAAVHSLNGNGELTGSHWIRDSGSFAGPVMLTNTHAVGTVHRGVVDWTATHRPDLAAEWLLPVVGETWDGYLNSINQPFVTTDDAGAAIDAASSSAVPEGSAGGGTGMNLYGFKGGNGTSSRQVSIGGATYTVGVFLQANFGDRSELMIQGVPLGDLDVPYPMGDLSWFAEDRRVPGGSGSCIAVVATDAPLIPTQCEALAKRVSLGLARTGTTGGHFSGDIFLAFSTGNAGALDNGFSATPAAEATLDSLQMVPWSFMDLLYTATVQATEEAVLNALFANRDMTGRAGHFSPALPHELALERLAARGRISELA
ncbi:DmpA family aminopeptidase [Demequina salsinemoris]|uniref:DmpA family aminopeptidase n=1 Tax=Demequina salsinemoris TaxID=577470 RepID=UPI000783C273|nr:P1 family peptidase [Demequina salsinemoris]